MIHMLLSKRGLARIRLSSIEPQELTDELIGFLGNGLCRHLHIPLQSGDDTILSSMKRKYTAGFYQDLLGKIADQAPGIALGADVMVGFPGEGEREFQNTLRLVERVPLSYLHVFSSARGTFAADMKAQVPEGVKKARSEALRDLGRRKNFDFRKKCHGSEFGVVVEDKIDARTGLFTGLTDNYIRVQIVGSKTGHIGKELQIRVSDVQEENIAIIL
jgi:threonylcarbamoyladenosine tRNA methylthiotransferase MtaB